MSPEQQALFLTQVAYAWETIDHACDSRGCDAAAVLAIASVMLQLGAEWGHRIGPVILDHMKTRTTIADMDTFISEVLARLKKGAQG